MNPIMFSVGPFHIYWYSFILLIGFVLGFFILLKMGEKEGISKSFIYDYACYLIPIVLVGARVYYVLFSFDYYIHDIMGIFRVWEGGLAIHGGILAGALFTYFYSKKKNVSFFKLTDILVISLILGQIIGRWGNFFNGEAYGPETTYTFLSSLHLPKFIIDGMHINQTYYHPTFLYESLWNFVGLLVLLFIKKRSKVPGTMSAFYIIHYGIGRLLIESLRQDSLMLGSIKVAQLISVVMVILGILILVFIRRSKKNATKI